MSHYSTYRELFKIFLGKRKVKSSDTSTKKSGLYQDKKSYIELN